MSLALALMLTLALALAHDARSTFRRNSVAICRLFSALATAPKPLDTPNNTEKFTEIPLFQPSRNCKSLINNLLLNRSLYQVVNISPDFAPFLAVFAPVSLPK